MSLSTGRIAIDENGDIYQLGAIATAPAAGLTVAMLTAGAPAATEVTPPAVSLGEPMTIPDGTQLPAGIWEIEGSVYAGYGGAVIRQVVFGEATDG